MKVAILLIILSMSSVSFAETADPEDMRFARKFVSELPPDCHDATILIASDGTVTINYSCKKDDRPDPKRGGSIEIKNRTIKKIR